ncbi:unnamed protein product [Lactuca virosa]|uniref:Uncharacterized protein n=1 Tax=Lactuca virosa TaxID=75947 RepID=A0AAU9LRG5_9ASTR|nr:unnamed protein product [Lactuca virosa]
MKTTTPSLLFRKNAFKSSIITFLQEIHQRKSANLRLTLVDGLKLVMISERATKPLESYVEIEETNQICNTSKQRSDTCEMKGDVRIQGNSSTIFVLSSHGKNASWTIKPYARKGDISAMERVTNFTIKVIQEKIETMPTCTKTHNVPVIVFSVGGYAGNNFVTPPNLNGGNVRGRRTSYSVS